MENKGSKDIVLENKWELNFTIYKQKIDLLLTKRSISKSMNYINVKYKYN